MTDKRDAWDQYPAERAAIADAIAASPSGVTLVQHDYPGDELAVAAFLSARLDDDEAVARAAEEMAGSAKWATDSPNISRYGHYVQTEDTRIYTAGLRLSLHIARHDPARVLADVEAKRRIVAACEEIGYDTGGDESALAIRTLRLLALPYTDHPDYDERWRA